MLRLCSLWSPQTGSKLLRPCPKKANKKTKWVRDGMPDHKFTKWMWGWGGVRPLPVFFWRIWPHALRALKGDHSSPKSDNYPTKVFLFPHNRSFNHIYLTFSLSEWFYALLSKNVASRIYTLLWAKSLRMPGGQPNLGNAWILGTFGQASPP